MKQIIYNKDKAYQLVRVLKEDQLKNPDTSLLKKWFMCDTSDLVDMIVEKVSRVFTEADCPEELDTTEADNHKPVE